jgi:hypothetical protein
MNDELEQLVRDLCDRLETHDLVAPDRAVLARAKVYLMQLPPRYDPLYGDDKLCDCGHPYYRHFDTYDDMAPVGCKYCMPGYGRGVCPGFKEAV